MQTSPASKPTSAQPVATASASDREEPPILAGQIVSDDTAVVPRPQCRQARRRRPRLHPVCQFGPLRRRLQSLLRMSRSAGKRLWGKWLLAVGGDPVCILRSILSSLCLSKQLDRPGRTVDHRELVGVGLAVSGLVYYRRGLNRFSSMLTAAGIVVLYLSTWSAFGFYQLLPQTHAVFSGSFGI